jgi:hypothetical protein
MFQRSQVYWTQSAFGVRSQCSILAHQLDFVDAVKRLDSLPENMIGEVLKHTTAHLWPLSALSSKYHNDIGCLTGLVQQ